MSSSIHCILEDLLCLILIFLYIFSSEINFEFYQVLLVKMIMAFFILKKSLLLWYGNRFSNIYPSQYSWNNSDLVMARQLQHSIEVISTCTGICLSAFQSKFCHYYLLWTLTRNLASIILRCFLLKNQKDKNTFVRVVWDNT